MFGEIDYSSSNPHGSSSHRLSRVLPGVSSSDIQHYSQTSSNFNWKYYSFQFLLNNFNIMPINDTTFLNSTISNYTSNLEEKTPPEDEVSDYFLYLIIPLYSLVFVIGTIGNILVILTVVTVKQMRNTTNALILHLAIANLSFVLMCIPHTIYIYVVHSYYFPSLLCKLANTLMYLSAYVSIYILVLMSVDRFLGVVFAVKSSKYRTQRNAHLAVIVVWLIGIIFSSPNMFYYDVLLNDESADFWVCLFRDDKPFLKTLRRVTAYFFALFGLIVPLIIIVILYGLIINVLRKNAKGQQVAKGKKRVTKMVSAVISSFIICWTPMQLYLLGTHHNQVSFLFAIVAQTLVYISACVNPILYAFLSEPFRKAFQEFLTCGKFLSNHKNGNNTVGGGGRKHATYNAIQRQQPKRGLPLKSNLHNDHQKITETNSLAITSEAIENDRLLHTNTTNIN
ncbi:unnamed protein product [Adineta steineri]|uniref:G-protein coupled receptors family 1 profile domain-containing protein n=1 Tax=Adineta steineri TaxID=433720 RepID=A0A819DCT2_9BILA|nr:unnamed protein product [Adineta steineri]CAF3832410.1 unnamed protein product [Adineta steineri]